MNFKYTLLFIFLFGIISCSKHNGLEPIKDREKAVFIYMIGDNNLDYYAVSNLNEMEEALELDGSVYVYIDRAKNAKVKHPIMYKVVYDNSKLIKSQIEYVYPERNSADSSNFRLILNDVIAIANKRNETLNGVILWSHGSAWLPKGNRLTSNRGQEDFRSFGLDEGESPSEGEEMDIIGLSKSLEGLHFDYLIFDACFMGSMEVVYELKDNFKYIIASPTEILASGLPYKEILPLLFKDKIDYRKICDIFIEKYNRQKGILKSASISLVETERLEGFARLIKDSFTKKSIDKALKKGVQYELSNSMILFDIGTFIEEIEDPIQKKKVVDEFTRIIPYYKHTKTFFGKLKLDGTKGISIFIPNKYIKTSSIEFEYYKKTSWAKDTSLFNFIPNR